MRSGARRWNPVVAPAGKLCGRKGARACRTGSGCRAAGRSRTRVARPSNRARSPSREAAPGDAPRKLACSRRRAAVRSVRVSQRLLRRARKRPQSTSRPQRRRRKRRAAAPDVAKPKAPPLDLDSLKRAAQGHRSAIGVLTKITLKNQVDDLLDQFRAYYQGKLKITLAELRRSFDLLVQKVLVALAGQRSSNWPLAIVASRDAIWGILSDPKKFATI